MGQSTAGDVYSRVIVHPGKEPALFVLVAFLLAFVFIRTSARLTRSPKVPWWPGSVTTKSGLHIHHLVWGICLLMIAGFLEFSLNPGRWGQNGLAILFGIGAGLTLDEFALFLRLDDVYWSAQGRVSIDAVVLATLVGCLVFVGASPIGVDQGGAWWAYALTIAFVLVGAASAFLKGKIVLGVVGLFIPIVGWVAALRLAKPTSPWARWRYKGNPHKTERAKKRAGREAGLGTLRRRIVDAISGISDK